MRSIGEAKKSLFGKNANRPLQYTVVGPAGHFAHCGLILVFLHYHVVGVKLFESAENVAVEDVAV